jgi:hypothetical protein
MKRFFVPLLAVIGILGMVLVSNVSAAPATAGKAGPYEGIFHGTVYAPDGSKAAMSLDLTHRDSVVEGTVFLGKGLTVDAGLCGEAEIPATSIKAAGKTSTLNDKKLSTVSTFDVSGVPVKVILDGTVSGDNLDATAKIDLPWLCGSDPVLTGKLHRE